MNRSVSNASVNEDKNIKVFQRKFLRALCVEELEPASVDLPDVVCLLQALGYHIRSIDASSPNDMQPLKNGEKGSKVLVKCLHSGMRCSLEHPEEKENCKCIIKIDENLKDCFWEVTATTASNTSASKGESIVETGCELTPNVSKELATFVKQALNCLIHMIHGSIDTQINNLSRNSSASSLFSNTSKGATSSPNQNARRLSVYMREIGANTPIVVTSPVRCRSFDNLRDQENIMPQNNMTPNKNKKLEERDTAKSSPNIHLAVTREERSNSSCSTLGESNYEKITELLVAALSLLHEQKGQQISPAVVTKLLKNKSGSKNIFSKKKTTPGSAKKTPAISSNQTPKKPKSIISKMTASSAPRSNVCRPQINTTTVVVEPKMAKTNLPKKAENQKPIKKPSTLYAHIKSTIPKPMSKSNSAGSIKNLQN